MMRWLRSIGCCVVVALLGAMSTGVRADTLPKPLPASYVDKPPYSYTGRAMSDTGSCSGAVVSDPRLVLSAAHCMYDQNNPDDPWSPHQEWFLRWHQRSEPVSGSGQMPRGYYMFAKYAVAARETGVNSDEAFDYDFLVNYGYEKFAEQAAPLADNGVEYLTTSKWKLLVGYPVGLYRDQPDHPDINLMHYTGPFNNALQVWENSFVGTEGVNAAPGNSGGPAFGWDGTRYLYIGTVVSGLTKLLGASRNFAGVNGISPAEVSLIQMVIEAANELTPDPPAPPGPPDTPDSPDDPDDGNDAEAEAEPMIEIQGNLRRIRSGDTTPAKADKTDFGTASRRQRITRRYTIKNIGYAPLLLQGGRPIRIEGAGARYFRVQWGGYRQVPHGRNASFEVTFLASPRGTFAPTVSISSNEPDTPVYRFKIRARRR